ncbi:hypothetical protein [Bradyrhizobium cenepequi]|uniref:hypothetical protein n=1 Tax=Bradyrhizobium cenepequi TaxID=2821403 RepID=UPI001CE2B750|nr:hypothetical protein [Bradyrhizobium cenepequi]MCA6110469.1 hypothetical protein [Bradyrhizobium cenepequi]
MKIARAAEAAGELALAADCWGKLAAFVHPKPRPVEIDPDSLVDLERRIARVRLEEASNAVKDNPLLVGLADRLVRAKDRQDALEAATFPQPAPPPVEAASSTIAGYAAAEAPAPQKQAASDLEPPDAPPPPPKPAYRPIMPGQEPVSWPSFSATARHDYDPLND